MTPTDTANTISLKDLAAILALVLDEYFHAGFVLLRHEEGASGDATDNQEERDEDQPFAARENGGEVFQGNSIGCVSRGHRGSLLATGCIWMRKRGDHSNPINSSRLRLRYGQRHGIRGHGPDHRS